MKSLISFLMSVACFYSAGLYASEQPRPIAEEPRVIAPGERPAYLLQDKGQLSGFAVMATPEQLQRGTDISISVIAAPQPDPLPMDAGTMARTRVVSVENPLPTIEVGNEAVKPDRASQWVEPAIPQGCLRPDGNGSIFINRISKTGEITTSEPRNPWGIRVATKATLTEYMINLTAIVIGPTPTAIIDGTPMAKSDRHSAAPFTLSVVRRHDVIMEYDGIFFLVPEGQTVTIRIPKS
jgi:hypothetical protein